MTEDGCWREYITFERCSSADEDSSLTPLVAILLIVTWHQPTHLVVITKLSFDESAAN